MKLTSLSDVNALLASLQFQPSRKLGQNFLVDANIVNFIMSRVQPGKDDLVLEIGPGLGVLTEPLVEHARGVIAIEKDKRLYEHLTSRFTGKTSLELICADALDVNFNELMKQGITKVVSNLPYSVGSRILVNLIEADPPPRYMLVTVQKEVGDRLRAKPATKDYGLLSIWAQLYYDVVMDKIVSPTCFLPAPEIKSAIVELRRHSKPTDVKNRVFFNQLIKLAFSNRRKQLGPTLEKNARVLSLEQETIRQAFLQLNLDLKQRPDELTPDMWMNLSNQLR